MSIFAFARHIGVAGFAAVLTCISGPDCAYAQTLSPSEAQEIATDAYVYAYPLVLMDATRRSMTNVEAVTSDGRAPVNQFAHKRTYPDASFTDVVRPNADTLYSTLWFDVGTEPLVIDVPDSKGRYHLLPMLDMWTDVFASPGTRTTGNVAQTFAIVGPHWEGTLPSGVEEIRSPTNQGWMLGRTQANGTADFKNVHVFQDGLTAVPLSGWKKTGYAPAKGMIDPNLPKLPPMEVVERMDAATFFTRFIELTRNNPPHANDYPILQRMKRIGLEPGKPFDIAQLSPEIRSSLDQSMQAGIARIKAYAPDNVVNGWSMVMNPVGTYATDYNKRSLIAYLGLGANVLEDAIYPSTLAQLDGTAYDSGQKYVLHFSKDKIPPARAFWSVTMYNEQQFFAENPINRYAIGDRDSLKFNKDGSLDLYIQRESPGKEREANWLPAPKSGKFTVTMRLYWPKAEALDGTWTPPTLKRAD